MTAVMPGVEVQVETLVTLMASYGVTETRGEGRRIRMKPKILLLLYSGKVGTLVPNPANITNVSATYSSATCSYVCRIDSVATAIKVTAKHE
eukprot:scaffold48192_cov88-Cyclotella_meneghiniana.AAC.6